MLRYGWWTRTSNVRQEEALQSGMEALGSGLKINNKEQRINSCSKNIVKK
jgi:hypothetical protein